MKFILQILSNKYIVISGAAWFIAQCAKVINVIARDKRIDFRRFIGSGGMPSAHSAFIVSLTTVIGKNYGWESGEFGLAFAISLIVMYDAAGVRRAAGKQAKALNSLLHSNRQHVHFEGKLKELIGHSPFEVAMGALLGIVFGLYFG